jgi:DNA-binding transcriptional ArsR family regulator
MSSKKNKYNLVFKALGDPRRREILELLRKRPRTTGELCTHFIRLDRCTVMQHMGVLEKAGLILTKREGRFRWNHLNSAPIRGVVGEWVEKYA